LLGEEAEKPDRQLDGLVFTGPKDLLLEGARADLQLNKAEQSNSSIRFAKVMMKVYRKLQRGVHPEVEVGCFLTDVAKFKNTPRLLGTLEYRQSGEETITLSVCQELISDARDGWSHALVLLSDAGDFESPSGKRRSLVELCTRLGQRTAELHRAFAVDTDNPSFAAEPMTDKDAVDWSKRLIQEASGILDRLAASQQTEATARLLGKRSEVMGWLSAVAQMKISACKTRLHGDYHLGQVLVSDGDVYIIDFEGEPMRSLQERRRKQLPLRDVAGMLRSFDYLLEASRRGDNNAATDGLLTEMRSAFLMTYQNKIAGCSSFPNDMRQANELLLVYLLEKSIYEIGYELSNRPDWIDIPVRSLLAIIEQPMSMFE
jgi:maltose alpha-D-glucosyltransferase/alpha-amylase